jgi:predicted PurR-regulated permease PerM
VRNVRGGTKMGNASPGRPYRVVLFALGVAAAMAIVVLTVRPLLVVFAGFLFALVLRGIAEPIARKTKVPYVACLAALVIALIATVALGIVLVGPTLRDQIEQLTKTLPSALHSALEHARSAQLAPVAPEAKSPTPDAPTIARGAAAAGGAILEIASGFVVVFFVGVYGAARPDDYASAIASALPREARDRARRIMREICNQLTRWLLGRLVAMVFVGATCTVAFSLLRVPLALSLGVLAGLLTFVEYVGAVISAVPAMALGFTKSPETALWVLLVYTALHMIEGYVLTPLLARAAVRFPAAMTLAGQVVFAALVGPLGLTLSTPLLAAGAVTVRSLRQGPAVPFTSECNMPRQLDGRLPKTIRGP